MEKRVFFRKVREHIYLVIYGGRKRIYITTGVKVKDKHWDGNFITKAHPYYYRLYDELICLEDIANAAIKLLPRNASITDVREKFLELKRTETDEDIKKTGIKLNYDFIDKFKDFMQRRRVMLKPRTIAKYGTTLNHLLNFESQTDVRLDIQTFDKILYEQLITYLIIDQNLLNNSVAKHVAVLKTFIKDVYPEFDTRFMRFGYYKPEVIALTEDELIRLIEVPFTGNKELAKDFFIFMCVTGMRVSDVKRFNPNWVRDDFIEYSAEKTMSKAYVPLLETAKGILEKYKGKPPNMCEQYFNREIKKVCYDIGLDRPVVKIDRQGRRIIEHIHPLYEVVSSHTGRKTFVSMMLARGVPIQDVMNMSGHQDYRSMKPYIQVDKKRMSEYKKSIKF